jgi:hypothetical protein
MSIFLDIGSDKCKTLFYYECPACGDQFEFDDGVKIHSATLDDRVFLCPKHKDPLNVDEEIAIQNALQITLNSPRGRITSAGKVIKKTIYMEKFDRLEREARLKNGREKTNKIRV